MSKGNYAETHQIGRVSVENESVVLRFLKQKGNVDFGLQTASDGRIWINIEGIVWIRFRPSDMGNTNIGSIDADYSKTELEYINKLKP